MPPRKDIYKEGVKTQFSSTNQPQNPGRRPSVFAKYIRENRIALDDIRALISSLLGYDVDEIQKILKDEKNKPPVGIMLMLKAITTDMSKGDISNFEKLMDRAYGKPTQTIIDAVAHVDTENVLKNMSDSELIDIINNGKKKNVKRK